MKQTRPSPGWRRVAAFVVDLVFLFVGSRRAPYDRVAGTVVEVTR